MIQVIDEILSACQTGSLSPLTTLNCDAVMIHTAKPQAFMLKKGDILHDYIFRDETEAPQLIGVST